MCAMDTCMHEDDLSVHAITVTHSENAYTKPKLIWDEQNFFFIDIHQYKHTHSYRITNA
jgi:hypothetical protein